MNFGPSFTFEWLLWFSCCHEITITFKQIWGWNLLVWSLWYQIWPGPVVFFFYVFCWTEILPSPQNEMIRLLFIKLLFAHAHTHTHTHTHTHAHTPLLMSWLCLLVVHSMIEMGVWVLSGRKSACQLAFSALFPISIKHLHHLLWAHSTTPCFSPEPCTTDRWCALGTNHFSSCTEDRVTPCS